MTKHFIILLSIFFIGCGPSLVSTGAKTVIKENEDEKTFSESWDDATIKLGIKVKYFSYDASLFTRIDVEVELGKVLLTGVVPYGDMRLEAVRLAWKQDGVIEVLNEISIDTGYGHDDIAKDKIISTQLNTKIFTQTKSFIQGTTDFDSRWYGFYLSVDIHNFFFKLFKRNTFRTNIIYSHFSFNLASNFWLIEIYKNKIYLHKLAIKNCC